MSDVVRARAMRPFDRHDLDRIAGAVVSGCRGLGARRDRLADAVARRAREKLAAVGVPGAQRAPARMTRRELRPEDAAFVPVLLARVDKHLAWAAMQRVHGNIRPLDAAHKIDQ